MNILKWLCGACHCENKPELLFCENCEYPRSQSVYQCWGCACYVSLVHNECPYCGTSRMITELTQGVEELAPSVGRKVIAGGIKKPLYHRFGLSERRDRDATKMLSQVDDIDKLLEALGTSQ